MNATRLFVLILAAAGLTLFSGCDGGGDLGGDGTDIGVDQPDGGEEPDGGEDPVEDTRTPRQPPREDPTIGGHCSMDPHDLQGSCGEGLACVPADEEENICTDFCAEDADCGMHGSHQNRCMPVTQTDSACYRGCDPDVPDSCGRANWSCWPFTTPICLPDCRVQGNDLCPSGTGCDPRGGFCRPAGSRTHYQSCDEQNRCDIDGVCLVTGEHETTGTCMFECTGRPTACPSGNHCALPLGGGRYICAQPCSAANPACPTGTECMDVGGGLAYCLP